MYPEKRFGRYENYLSFCWTSLFKRNFDNDHRQALWMLIDIDKARYKETLWWNYNVHKSRVSQIKSTGGGGGTILAEWPITADFGSKKLEDMGGQGVVEGSRGGSPQSTLY